MNRATLSLTTVEPFENKEEAALQLLRELYAFMAKKGYSNDLLYRDAKNAKRFVHLRIWKSPEAKLEAQEDPDVHHFWMRLPEVCEISNAQHNLELLFSSMEPKSTE
jgi:hypothetical protein